MKRIIGLLSVVFMVAGCSTTSTPPETSLKQIAIPDAGAVHPVKKEKYLSCDAAYFQHSYNGTGHVYGAKYEKVANQSFLYALMSASVYNSSPQFVLPNWKRTARYHSTTGFTADVWINDMEKEAVVAYVGKPLSSITHQTKADLNSFFDAQYEDSELLVNQVMETHSGYKLTVTGHDLGGALALHNSLVHDGMNAVVFDASPRLFGTQNYPAHKNMRLLVSGSHDMVSAFQHMDLNMVAHHGPYNQFNFLHHHAEGEHSMYPLARGLTTVAASTGNKVALQVMNDNLGCKLKK